MKNRCSPLYIICRVIAEKAGLKRPSLVPYRMGHRTKNLVDDQNQLKTPWAFNMGTQECRFLYLIIDDNHDCII